MLYYIILYYIILYYIILYYIILYYIMLYYIILYYIILYYIILYYTGCLKKKYPLLIGNRNETIRYNYSPSGQLNLSIFNLDSHTLHSRIVHQTPEIQTCKGKVYNAHKTRGFFKGPSHDLCYGSFPKFL